MGTPGFKKGEGGRPKGVKNKATRDIRALIDKYVSEDDWGSIIKAMVTKASAGDAPAAKFIAEYRYGRPLAVEVSGTDGQPIQHQHSLDPKTAGSLVELANKLSKRS